MQTFLLIIVIVSGTASLGFLISHKLSGRKSHLKIAVLFSFIIFIGFTLKTCPKTTSSIFGGFKPAYAAYEDKYMEMGGRYFGKYLSKIKGIESPCNVLVIDYPKNCNISGSEMSPYALKGLKEGFKEAGDKCTLAYVENANAADNSQYWFEAKEFDRIVLAHMDAGLVVSLVGLPHDFQNISIAEKIDKVPQFAFLGGDLSLLGEAIRTEESMVTAAVVIAPGASLGSSEKPDFSRMEEQFFEHFILVDKSNLKDSKEVFPILFK